MIYEFNGYRPVVHESSFVHPLAAVTGNVVIGRDVYIAPGAAIRGDWGQIRIGNGCNVQENCTLHMFPGQAVVLEDFAHIGHGAIIHGAHIGKNSLIGMNAVIMDRVTVGPECIVGALAFVKEQMEIPARKVVAGNPARIIKDVSEEMIAWKTEGTRLYRQLPQELHHTLKECEPLREEPSGHREQPESYETWGKRKS